MRSAVWDKSDKRWRSEQTVEVTNNTSIQVVKGAVPASAQVLKEVGSIRVSKLKTHTRTQLHKAMQLVLSFLSFTTETEDKYDNGYIPTLDLQTYKFFKKLMFK